MHIPDGFVSLPINSAAAIVSAAVLAWGVRRVSREAAVRPGFVPLLASTASFVFAAQMLNFPVAAGTSGHFVGAVTVAALLGPWSACVAMAAVLAVQCILFADGGLSALGTNFFNMGIVAGLLGGVLLRAVRALLPRGRRGFLAAAALASWASVVAAASLCALELSASGTAPLSLALPAMAGVHAVIGLGEALIAVAVLGAVVAVRPDVLPAWADAGEPDTSAAPEAARRRAKALAVAGLVAAFAVAAFLSPLASGSPDGLERVASDQGFEDQASPPAAAVWGASPFPDYEVEGLPSPGLATGAAGVLGTAAVFGAGFVALRLLTRRREHAAKAG